MRGRRSADDTQRARHRIDPVGRTFLDHARLALNQAEAATEAARRSAQPPRRSFAIGFLTGYEMDWLPAVMEILRAELPSTEVVLFSQDSPDLAAGLIRGKIDLALLRPEKQASGLKFRLLKGPLDRRDAAQPLFGCPELDSPAGHRGPEVYRSVPAPGTDPVGCY
jgi:DNA-binding transcriptional LysR family regulator